MQLTKVAIPVLLSHSLPSLALAAPPLQLTSDYAQNKTVVGKVISVNPAGPVKDIASAAKLAQDGDTVEIQAGDYYGDVASWTQNNLTIRAVGGRVKLNPSGLSAEGKAIWVIRGGTVRVEGIDFTNARVPDRNGAGIRFEKGKLFVSNCTFINNENGILAGEGKESTLEVENSEFGYNGGPDGRSHNLYIGQIGLLKVSGSYFHHAVVGHLLKSRARENHITYNRLTDENGGRASYELEFPNGGVNYVIGNLIEQTPTTENSAIISMGGEDYAWPKNELYLSSNTIVDNRASNGVFLRVKPGATQIRAVNNILVGEGTLDGSGHSQQFKEKARQIAKAFYNGNFDELLLGKSSNEVYTNNFNLGWDQFAQAVRYDFHLVPANSVKGKFIAPGQANGVDLTPKYEYTHPARKTALKQPAMYPGAYQSLGGEKKPGG